MSVHDKITRHVGSVSVATAISRILGYFRDMLVAQAFGAGMLADAFYAAYRIPNLFRRLFGEGSVSNAFIPVFSEYFETKGKDEAVKLFHVVFTVLLIILLAITFLGIVFAAPLTRLIAWGFSSDPAKMSAAINLTRIMFPFLLFACMSALLLGVLNSRKVFFAPAVAPAFLSIAEILYVVIFISIIVIPEGWQIKGLAISVVVGGMGQYIMQHAGVSRAEIPVKLSFDFKHSGLKKIFYLMIPMMFGFSVDQLNSFVDTICASFISEGSIAALYYSNRLMQLPLALFGIAIATVSLPHMSDSAVKNDMGELKKTLNFSLRMALFSLLPASIGLIILGRPIVQLLFERGAFTSTATNLTSSALLFYSSGLIAYSVSKILASAYYSMKDTKTPVRTAAFCMIVNVALNIALMGSLGVGGLALATSISSWLNASILIVALRKKIGLLGIRKIMSSFVKILFSCCIMAAGAVLTYNSLKSAPLFISVFSSIIVSVLLFFTASKLTNTEELNPVLSLMRKENIPDE